jgi:hypothetical protein
LLEDVEVSSLRVALPDRVARGEGRNVDLLRVGEGDPFPEILSHSARHGVEEEAVV